MAEQFRKGITNNHLTWLMVDSVDFATPESALSAATKIKIYGKLKSATGVNFVSSGTGSLTNDIQHVGASALGIYTIALAKADLSDASAAWYDTYIISLSATGAAYQTLIADGGILQSYLSDVASYLSNLVSNMSGIQSDVYSGIVALSDAVSNAYSAAVVGASRVLLVQSRLSDLDSRLVSDLSDVLSQLTVVQSYASDAASAAAQGNSRVLLVQSRLSDLDSRFVSDVSDIRSMLTALSDMVSNVDSAVNSQYSDVASKIGAITVTLTASDISDIASATAAAVGSTISDIYSLLSDFYSDFQSRVTKKVATDSQLSDLSSDIKSAVIIVQSRLSDLDSRLVSDVSDILSQLTIIQSMASDAASAAQQGNSRVLVAQSMISDVDSALSSQAVLSASSFSDILSAANRIIGEIPTNLSALLIDSSGKVTLTNLAARLITAGAVQAGTTDTLINLAATASTTDDEYVGYDLTVYNVSTNAILAVRRIIDYVGGATKQATLDKALDFTPTNGTHGYQITGANGRDDLTILAQLPSAPPKNTAFTYVVKMVQSADHVTPATGLTITMTRSLDAAAFGAATGTVTELTNGHYKIAASAADMNGDVVTHRFTAAGADDLTMEFQTVS